jgi:nitrate/nitrite transport system ATP-binding protein
MSSHYLSIENVDMVFNKGSVRSHVLSNVNLQIDQGEFISIIGHSGCGKSTVLNIVAGLIEQTSGAVILDRKEVNSPGPDRALVFQNHSLLPWLTVYENVALAVNKVVGRSKSAAEKNDWILHNLELVNMLHALHKKPSEISGGMKQRVGIARALAMQPKVLLLDEPFGALDALTRAHLQDEVMKIHSNLKNTVMMITHDVDEAVLLSDRIVMMSNGPAATIGEILHIDLPRPRDRITLAEDPRYNHYRQEVLRFLYEKQRKLEHINSRQQPSQSPNAQSRPGVGSDSLPSGAANDVRVPQKALGVS